jgi:hypothetical protein
LRAALTGQFHGPALDATVALLGKAASLARLEAVRRGSGSRGRRVDGDLGFRAGGEAIRMM